MFLFFWPAGNWAPWCVMGYTSQVYQLVGWEKVREESSSEALTSHWLHLSGLMGGFWGEVGRLGGWGKVGEIMHQDP